MLDTVIAQPDYTPAHSPVEERAGVLLKREDLWSLGGASGAKARALAAIAADSRGLVTAGSRISPQLERAALIARVFGIPARLHTGAGRDTAETSLAGAAGAELLRHSPGRLSVIRARFRSDAAAMQRRGWAAVPYGMEHPVYLQQVAAQARHVAETAVFGRVVVPVGSGMSIAAIVRGMRDAGCRAPILGIRVGGDPAALLDRYAPGWRPSVTLVASTWPYEAPVAAELDGVRLDPHYEAKCLPYLRPGDLLWCVGARTSLLTGARQLELVFAARH